MAVAALFLRAKKWKKTQMSTEKKGGWKIIDVCLNDGLSQSCLNDWTSIALDELLKPIMLRENNKSKKMNNITYFSSSKKAKISLAIK